MKRVLKWNVPVDDRRHKIGAGRVVHVACQDTPSIVQVWTEEYGPGVKQVEIQIYGTGQTYHDDGQVVGSTVTAGGALVWHVVRFMQYSLPIR